MHCLQCGYDLRALTEPRCPECGLAFDPDRRQTWGNERAAKYARLARIAGWACAIIASAPAAVSTTLMAIGREDLFIHLLMWVYTIAPLAVALCVWVGCLAGSGRLPGWRATAVGALLFLFNASLFTQWPIHASFLLHRSALNKHAQQAQQLHTYNVPSRIGVYQVDRVSMAPVSSGKNAIIIKLKSDPAGPAYLVSGMTDQEIESRFNIWSYRRLDEDWHVVHED